MSRTFCDRCGKEIDLAESAYLLRLQLGRLPIAWRISAVVYHGDDRAEVCGDCWWLSLSEFSAALNVLRAQLAKERAAQQEKPT